MWVVILTCLMLPVGTAACRRDDPVADLMRRVRSLETHDPRITTVVALFTPADCSLTATAIEQLRDLDSRPFFNVRSVMLDPPPKAAERARVLKAFHAPASVLYDSADTWRHALVRSGLRPPVVVVLRRGSIVRLASAEWAEKALEGGILAMSRGP
ncbi:MAG TPA: hypothetical protein VKB18_02295 [Gemmatimonadota bacterium]|nr:hypothetical protein [Gemmatimonadota bacterium]